MEPNAEHTGGGGPPGRAPSPRGGRRLGIGIGETMALIAGLGMGLWLARLVPHQGGSRVEHLRGAVLFWAAWLLGGLSVVGPPLLLAERRRRRGGRPWGAGKVLWFSSGTAAWLLWPPVVVRGVAGREPTGSPTALCFIYGTPLMALYVTAALVAGGWLGRRRRQRLARSWRETFGLILGLAWACTGLYVLEMLYEGDLFQ